MTTRIANVIVGKNPIEMQTGDSEYLTVIMENGAFHQIIVNLGENARDFSSLLERLAKEIRNISEQSERAERAKHKEKFTVN